MLQGRRRHPPCLDDGDAGRRDAPAPGRRLHRLQRVDAAAAVVAAAAVAPVVVAAAAAAAALSCDGAVSCCWAPLMVGSRGRPASDGPQPAVALRGPADRASWTRCRGPPWLIHALHNCLPCHLGSPPHRAHITWSLAQIKQVARRNKRNKKRRPQRARPLAAEDGNEWTMVALRAAAAPSCEASHVRGEVDVGGTAEQSAKRAVLRSLPPMITVVLECNVSRWQALLIGRGPDHGRRAGGKALSWQVTHIWPPERVREPWQSEGPSLRLRPRLPSSLFITN